MIDIDIETAIWLVIGFFLFVKVGLPMIFPPNPPGDDFGDGVNIEKQINKNANTYKKIDKENLALENLHIQKEELENEIDKLEIEASTDFEKEASNNTRIKKLRLKIKHLDINIENKYNNIDVLNRDLQGMY